MFHWLFRRQDPVPQALVPKALVPAQTVVTFDDGSVKISRPRHTVTVGKIIKVDGVEFPTTGAGIIAAIDKIDDEIFQAFMNALAVIELHNKTANAHNKAIAEEYDKSVAELKTDYHKSVAEMKKFYEPARDDYYRATAKAHKTEAKWQIRFSQANDQHDRLALARQEVYNQVSERYQRFLTEFKDRHGLSEEETKLMMEKIIRKMGDDCKFDRLIEKASWIGMALIIVLLFLNLLVMLCGCSIPDMVKKVFESSQREVFLP